MSLTHLKYGLSTRGLHVLLKHSVLPNVLPYTNYAFCPQYLAYLFRMILKINNGFLLEEHQPPHPSNRAGLSFI